MLQNYWYRLFMVTIVSRYYGPPFKGFQVVTQGDPLSLKLFNIVVDVVFSHWIMI